MKFFPFGQDTLVSPCGSKIRSKSLDLLRFLRYWHFFIFSKYPRWPPKVAKNEIFPLWTEHSCITPRVKNSLEIARSLTIFEILTLFHFPQKSKMAAKSGENWNFPPLHSRLLYHPAGQKFARNRSISYGFRDIDTFLFSAKIQHGRQKWRKSIFFPFAQDTCATLLVKNSFEIALSLTVLEIFTLFHFPQKSKMAAKSGENWNFTPLHRTFLYYLAGQKFARNRSISYGFRDIHTFSFFPLKSKMAAKSGENWNLSPLHRTLLYYPEGLNAIVFKLQVISLMMVVSEKSKSSYYSLIYWDRHPSYSPCCCCGKK